MMGVNHYPDLAEDQLWERREYLLSQREANLKFPIPARRIRMELIRLADALDACKHPDHR